MMLGEPSAANAPLEQTTFVSVAVIGGGVAGLAATGALASSSSSSSKDQQAVLLLEARDELGGRVRQLRGLAPWPIEMGPEFVHGERSSVVVSFFFSEAWPVSGSKTILSLSLSLSLARSLSRATSYTTSSKKQTANPPRCRVLPARVRVA
jgi:monoamine oxidase